MIVSTLFCFTVSYFFQKLKQKCIVVFFRLFCVCSLKLFVKVGGGGWGEEGAGGGGKLTTMFMKTNKISVWERCNQMYCRLTPYRTGCIRCDNSPSHDCWVSTVAHWSALFFFFFVSGLLRLPGWISHLEFFQPHLS